MTLLSEESERSSLDQSTSVVGVDMDSERARKVREAAGSAARLARGSCVEYARRPGRTEVALRVRITRAVGPPMLHAVAAALISAARPRTGRAWGVLPGDKLIVVAAREAGALRREGMRAGREREADERESRGLVASHACKGVSLLGHPRKADPALRRLWSFGRQPPLGHFGIRFYFRSPSVKHRDPPGTEEGVGMHAGSDSLPLASAPEPVLLARDMLVLRMLISLQRLNCG